MIAGGTLMILALLALAGTILSVGLHWPILLAVWFAMGLGYASVQTPSGRLIRRSAPPEARPALFAAQFALSHACWLVSYPLSGWLMTDAGLVPTLLTLGTISFVAVGSVRVIWSSDDVEAFEHHHGSLPLHHPHLQGVRTHAHTYLIDEHHPRWARRL